MAQERCCLVNYPPKCLLDLCCCQPALQHAPLAALPGTLRSPREPAAHTLQRRQASSQLAAWSVPAASNTVSTAETAQRAAHGLDQSARPRLLSHKPLPGVCRPATALI